MAEEPTQDAWADEKPVTFEDVAKADLEFKEAEVLLLPTFTPCLQNPGIPFHGIEHRFISQEQKAYTKDGDEEAMSRLGGPKKEVVRKIYEECFKAKPTSTLTRTWQP